MDGEITSPPAADLAQKIVRALACSPIFLMPYVSGDAAQERLLHQVGRKLGARTATVGFMAFRGKVERHGCVLFEKVAQADLI